MKVLHGILSLSFLSIHSSSFPFLLPYLLCPWELWWSIVMSTSVCVSVCLSASTSLEPHARSLPIFCACCLWLWLGPPSTVWRNPKGKGNFGGCPRHSKALVIFAAAIAATFAAKGITQTPITSCSRRGHSVCQASANRYPENSECRRCGLLAGKGVMGVQSAGKVWYLRLPCYGRPAQQMRTLYFCPVVSFYLFFLA